MKQKHRRKIAVILTIILLLSSLRMITFADPSLIESSIHEGITVEPPDSLGGGENPIMPLDITYDSNVLIGATTVATTVYYAPHPNVSASTGYTLPAGTGFYCMGREYEYLYIYWYINGKEMFGYIPYANTNMTSNHYWINYDIFRPATCSATTPVLSFAGTTNTYMSTGEIYQGENPLMVLGKRVNPYNNRTYYYVQYQTSAGLVKRGWIDADNGTVTIRSIPSTTTLDYSNSQFSFVNKQTGMALTHIGATVTQADFTGALNQTFRLEKVYYDGVYSGYYKIVSIDNENLALSINSTGYSEGVSYIMSAKGHPDKRQEFRIDLKRENNVFSWAVLARSSGEFRSMTASSTSVSIYQSWHSGTNYQYWTIYQVDEPFAGTFGQYDGNEAPFNFSVHYDSESLYDFQHKLPLANAIDAVNQWNSAYPKLSLSLIEGLGNDLSTNRLATIRNLSLRASTGENGALGRCRPIIRSGNTLQYIDNLDGIWHSTIVHLDMEYMTSSGYSQNEIKEVLIHELGHSLKQTHTYLEYVTSTGGLAAWDNIDSVNTIMNPTDLGNTISALDEWRVKEKWESVS